MGVEVDYKQARLGMRRRFDRADDFRPIFRWARDELQRANRANFASAGTASGRPWLPLDGEYSRWKLANAGPRPLLVFDGKLRRSLTNLRGAPNEIDKKSAVFGTNVSYAKWHQFGTRKMPQRKVVFVPAFFSQALAEKMADHIVHGRFNAGGTLLKGLF